jgi:ATP-binding cassette subfamily F protein uup
LVSHDRAFLDNVVTQVIAFEGDGKLQEYVGGYEDWVRAQKYKAAQAANKPAISTPPKSAAVAVEKPKASTKLNFKENRELEELPRQIEAFEQEQIEIATHLADGKIFRSDVKRAQQLQARSEEIDAQVLVLMARWEALEKKARG